MVKRKAKKAKPMYEFHNEWFEIHRPHWDENLKPLLLERSTFPDLRLLEIGCYEGRSTVWLLENIVGPCVDAGGHPALICVDAWPGPEYGPIKDRFYHNIKATGFDSHVMVREKPSGDVLPMLSAQFDFIYVDGSHKADDVFEDAIQAMRLIKVGGVVLFDDYCCSTTPGEEAVQVKQGINRAMDRLQMLGTTSVLGEHLMFVKGQLIH
jgi:predicted O-methyltransferase YrrM